MPSPVDSLVLQQALKSVQQDLLYLLAGYKKAHSDVQPFPFVTQVSLGQVFGIMILFSTVIISFGLYSCNFRYIIFK